jgi:hypothetical protein
MTDRVAQRIDSTWLEAVPRVAEDEAQGNVIVLHGWLLRAPAGRVRLVIHELCLEFRGEDVVGARERAAAPDARASSAIAAELHLRPGASLLAVHDVTVLQAHVSGGDVPFAVAARPGRLIAPPAPAFAASEASYLQHHGLAIDDPDPGAA